MKYCILLFLFLGSCAYQPYRQFNRDHEQDPECYKSYGGQWGYCDKVYRKGVPK